jgi:arsenite methyltransferase
LVRGDDYLRLRQYLARSRITRRLFPRRGPLRSFLDGLDRRLLRLYPADIRLRNEFNLWAETGLGATMEADHAWFTERALDKMSLSSSSRILDLGCGEGCASRLMATRSEGAAQVLGLDVSDEMVRRARIKSRQFERIAFLCASAEHIPCRDAVFTAALSVSAFYYFENQESVLKELFRVLAPGGQLLILVGLYKGVPDWHILARKLRVPVHVCSAGEYKSLLRSAGWVDIEAQELVQAIKPDRTGVDQQRALLISARRPCPAAGPTRVSAFDSATAAMPLSCTTVPHSTL